jgi:hypothetical protein
MLNGLVVVVMLILLVIPAKAGIQLFAPTSADRPANPANAYLIAGSARFSAPAWLT